MSSDSLSITDDEFNREVEALKSHRRHSVNRPVLDPDLPDLAAIYGGGQELLSADREGRGYDLVDDGQVATRSPSAFQGVGDQQSLNSGRSQFTARRRARGSQRINDFNADLRRSSDSADLPSLSPSASSSSSGRRSPGAASLSPQDPSHLFWVPASVHPEISPSDFRNFLREHAARAVSQHAGDDAELQTNDAIPARTPNGFPIAQRLNPVRQQQQDGHDFHSSLVSRATSLSRRGSTLRRQYRPEVDNDDSQDKVLLQRNPSGLSASAGPRAEIPSLTISDLQRLEAAAEEASQTQNPAMLRSVLRRTLSGSMPNELDTVDDVPAEPTQDPDAPIIVPKPGQILRRAARTKIRKASGDATPRASLASRRRGTTGGELDGVTEGGRAWELRRNSAEEMERRHSGQSEISSGAEDGSSVGHSSSRPTSAEAAESFGDANSRDSYHSDASQRTSVTSYADTISDSVGQAAEDVTSPRRTPTQDTIVAKASPQGYFDIEEASTPQPETQNRISSVGTLVSSPQHSPVEERGSVTHAAVLQAPVVEQQARAHPATAETPVTPVDLKSNKSVASKASNTSTPLAAQQQPLASSHRQKDKDKKGAFGLSWFGLGKDEDEEKAKADKGVLRKKERHEKKERKEREKEEKEREESSSSSFLGALFGKKKGQDDSASTNAHRSMQGQLTAGSLLERNELALKGKEDLYYARYPLHVERAIYRLSHIKLANPRRPLYEQVLISNLMFWYLGIINRNNQQQSPQQAQPQADLQQQQITEDKQLASQTAIASPSVSTNGGPVVDTSSAYDGIEPTHELDESAGPAAATDTTSQNGGSPANTPVKQKRTGLVKPNRAPAGSNRGRAETPMKQPGYGMQHRQINDDFKTMGTSSAPAGFVVGQVVDAQSLQANTPYRLVPDSQEIADHDQARSAATDFLGLGKHFASSEPFWSDPVPSDHTSTSPSVNGNLSGHSEADSDLCESHRWRGSTSAGGLQRSSSPNKHYRTEAEKERAWLGARPTSGSARGHSDEGEVSAANGNGNARFERAGHESHPQGRSLSLGGGGTTQRSGGDMWRSDPTVDRRRKVSAGSLSHSTSAQSVSPTTFDSIEEKGGVLSTSSSTPAMNEYTHQQYQQRSPTRDGAPYGHVSFPIAPGSNAMLEAARTSQSRRR